MSTEHAQRPTPNDDDYRTVINVVQAIRNKNTDAAAAEVADRVSVERERILSAVRAWEFTNLAGETYESLDEFCERMRKGEP